VVTSKSQAYGEYEDVTALASIPPNGISHGFCSHP
jgi:hypothetical protein